MFKSKIFYILFIIFLFCLVPNIVSAANIETETTTLDLTEHETEDNLQTKGWKWDNESKTLTLRNANFDVKDDGNSNPCIKLKKSDNIKIIFEGVNTLKSQKKAVIYANGGMGGSLTFEGKDNAILNLEITEISGIGGDNLGNTIHYVNNLNILSGTINSTGGFWVDGNLNISGGNLKIDTENMTYGSQNYTVSGVYVLSQVKITGGNVDIKANSAAIHVPGNSLYTEDTEDGVIITGGNVDLSTQAANTPAISAGQTKRKNIVINGGNITLAGDYGVYSYDGVINVNGFESLNADGVKNEVFKVRNATSNEIKYADADYSKVDEAIEEANKLNKDDYKDFSDVEKAIASVVRGKNILGQGDVNAMAKAIINAMNALELKDADYSKVDEAIEEANKLNKDDYKDFSGVEKAIASVVRGKNISEQEDVDAMAKAITNAINALELKETDETDEIDDTPKTGVEDLSAIVTFIVLGAIAGIVKLNKEQ